MAIVQWMPERVPHDINGRAAELSLFAPCSPAKKITLISDTSDYVICVVLKQEGPQVICISRMLNKVERGYFQWRKEALSVLRAVRRLHKYIFRTALTIVNDHPALQFLFDSVESVARSTAVMIRHWSIALAAYYYHIHRRPGRKDWRTHTEIHYCPMIVSLFKG